MKQDINNIVWEWLWVSCGLARTQVSVNKDFSSLAASPLCNFHYEREGEPDMP